MYLALLVKMENGDVPMSVIRSCRMPNYTYNLSTVCSFAGPTIQMLLLLHYYRTKYLEFFPFNFTKAYRAVEHL